MSDAAAPGNTEGMGVDPGAAERLRLLVEGTPHFFFYVQGLDGDVTYVSPTVASITGRGVDEWLGQHHWFATTNAINERAREVSRRHMAGRFNGEPILVEVQHADGHAVLLEAYESGSYRDGVLVGIQGIAHDVTHRVLAEKALRESERALATLMDNLPGMAYRCRNDRRWTMEFVSSGCLELTGYEPEALLGESGLAFADLILPEDRESVWDRVQEAVAQRRSFHLTYRILTQGGQVRWVWEKGVGVWSDDGSLRGLEGFVTDITERKRAEDQVGFQALLLDQVRNAVVATDSRGTITYWNRSAERMLGWRSEEVQGRGLAGVLIPLGAGSLARKVIATVRRTGTWEGELEVWRKNGGPVPIHALGGVVREGDGAARGFVAVATDVTERKRAEAVRSALLQISDAASSAASLDDLLPKIHGIVAGLMPATNFYIALYDAATLEISFPYFVDECDEHPVRDGAHRGLTEYVLRTGESLLASPEVFRDLVARGEVESVGSPSIDWLGVPLKIQDRMMGVLVVQTYTEGVRYSEDDKRLLEFVSNQVATAIDRTRAEQALRESEARHRALLEAVPDLIFHIAADGTFLDCKSARGEELFAPATTFLGRTLAEILPADVAGPALAHVTRALETGVVQAFEYRLAMAAEHRDFEARLVPVGGREVLAMVRNVTDRRRLEEQLRQAQKMEAVGRLAGGVAHDFNNLLQAVLSTFDSLDRRRGEPEKFAAALGELEGHVRRGSALTRQLLLFARREVSKPEQQDLNELVSSAGTLLRRLVRENVRFEIALAAEPLPVVVDRGQIEQVLVNLIVNAIDAMPDGGGLVVSTGRDAEEVWLRVSDAGLGIADEVRDRIFEPFFTTKSAGQGTGLGLAVVHGIVSRHRGRIEVESTPGRGTTFLVTLPIMGRTDSGSVTAVSRETAAVKGHGEGVLLVEDEAAVREGLKESLAMLGYTVTAAPSAEKAEELFTRREVAVVLTDLMLPGFNGAELARRLRARRPGLPVIVMSGYAEDEALRGLAAESVWYLQKPFDMDTLAKALRGALASHPER